MGSEERSCQKCTAHRMPTSPGPSAHDIALRFVGCGWEVTNKMAAATPSAPATMPDAMATCCALLPELAVLRHSARCDRDAALHFRSSKWAVSLLYLAS